MKNSHKLTTVGATLLLAATGGYAQSADKFYVNVDGGAAFQNDVTIDPAINGPGNTIKFDTGFRAGAELGYNINRSFAVELEVGIIRNTINQAGNQPLSSYGANAELNEIPLLVNGIYTFQLKGDFKPYVGVGVGMMAGILNSSKVTGLSSNNNPTYDGTDYTFAYQAELGFKYLLNKHINLGLAYKFTGTTDHSWTDNNINLKTDGTMTHSIEATFTWRF